MLDAYLREKFDLYTLFSRFGCDDSCPRYGCRGDLVVSASLLDIHAQSRLLFPECLAVLGIYEGIMQRMRAFDKDREIDDYLSALSIAEALTEKGVPWSTRTAS